MHNNDKVLVVGTTSDYIHWIRLANPGRALFITDPDVRYTAHEPPPERQEEIITSLDDVEHVTNAVGWERFETDYFPVLNLSRPALEEKQCDVLGSLCTPHDVWGYNYWGKDILPGDVLMIPCQGAYTYSLRQNFIKPLPTVVLM